MNCQPVERNQAGLNQLISMAWLRRARQGRLRKQGIIVEDPILLVP